MRRRGFLRLALSSAALLAVFLFTSSLAAQDDWPEGIRPKGPDGKPLNLGFEAGDLSDWHVEGKAPGTAFEGQPVKGDTVAARRSDMISGHRGQYWLGTYERHGDQPQGVLASVPFKVTQPFASFLVGGGSAGSIRPGSASQCRVEVINAQTGEIITQVSGLNNERMLPVILDLADYQGENIQIRIVDQLSGGWGHVNFDAFRFHKKRPEFPIPVRHILAHGLPPAQAARAMDLPPGFEVKVFAAEPDIVQPIAMYIDDAGRLWVAQAMSYPQKRAPEDANDKILIFEDTDDDGHFDTRKVFIEGLNLVSGLAVGFGGVWVGQAPYLLFIPDQNGDDVPDSEPQILLDGFVYNDTHETLNSFVWGPDGWLYGCHGVFNDSYVGKPGAPKEERTFIDCGVWRYHPTKHLFQVFAHGTSNPWGLDFNEHGQWFATACVIPHLYQIIDGARYVRQAGRHRNPYTYDDIKTIADHLHYVGNQWNSVDRLASNAAGGGHAHAGAMIYRGGRWPEKYESHIMMNNIHGARLNQDILVPLEGSGYVGHHGNDFLIANDIASQIVHFDYGPRGNVYAIDWCDTNQCHHREIEVHDRSNGRIFKISYTSKENMDPDAYLLPPGGSLKDLSNAELVQLQLHENAWYAHHARRILQERGGDPKTEKALVELTFGHPDDAIRLRGLWCLHVIGALPERRILRLLKDESPHVRGWTIQLALEGRQPTEMILNRFAELARDDPSATVRLYLASACQHLSLEERRPILAGLLTHPEDADDHNLPLMDWYAVEPLVPQDIAGSLALVENSAVPLVRKYTLRRIAQIGSKEAIAFLIEALGDKSEIARQQEYLAAINKALTGRRSMEMPQPWPSVYQKLSASDSPEIVAEARRLAVRFGSDEAIAETRAILTNEKAAPQARSAALQTLLGVRAPKLADVLIARSLITDPAIGRAAIRALGAYKSKKTPQRLIALYPKLNPQARRDALGTLASRPSYAQDMLDAIADGTIPRDDLTAGLIRQLRNLKDKALDERLNEVWGVVRDSPEAKKQLIKKFHKLLTQGGTRPAPDPHLGRALFDETCAQCHTLFGAGGEIGPELTGSNRDDLDYILSNVLDPSAMMSKDYQPDVIVTAEGRVVTGLVKEETKEAVTLVTENDTIVIAKSEIDTRVKSDTSMMPENLWKALEPFEVRSLVAYLAGKHQIAPRATPKNAATFFNGQNLEGWKGDDSRWKVDEGMIVGTSPGIKKNTFLVSDLLVDDFDLTVEVKLTPNRENSGIQFRSKLLDDGEMKGYQADMGVGWWGKLYEEKGRHLLWKKSAKSAVKPGQWNSYRIRAVGDHIQTWLNGHKCVDLHDPAGARSGHIGLQIHAGGPLTVRFRNVQLVVDPEKLTKGAPVKAAAR